MIHPDPSTPLRDLVVMVRDGCHLCEQFLLELSLELGPAFEQVRILDVDTDPELAVRYRLRMPVLEVPITLEGGNLLPVKIIRNPENIRKFIDWNR